MENHTNTTEITEDILFNYLKEELPEDIKHKVESWYLASTDNATLLENLYYAYSLSQKVDLMRVDTDYYLKELKNQIKRKSAPKKSHSIKLQHIFTRTAVAAMFTAVVATSSWWIYSIADKMQRPLVVKTAVGERVNIELPDGSKVWINACSELIYQQSLFPNERRVAMKGEVFFDVAKDKSTPFIVNSCDLNTHVLGTRFNISANNDDRFRTTTLLEGSIMVESKLLLGSKEITMSPNQQLKFDKVTKQVTLSACDDKIQSTNWIDGKLYFDGATFESIARSLERQFNIKILFKNTQLKKVKFSCDFNNTDNIDQILSILKLTGEFDYTINGREVQIYESNNNKRKTYTK